jgi:hypothetical protein
MSDRHDLRRQTREIQEALSRYDREQLIDILVHVFRIYVLEGASLSSASAMPSTADELQGLSFAQVIERLQLRLELPELQLFELVGGRVHVRLDGRSLPVELPSPRGDGASHLQVAVAAPSSPASPSPPRAPSVEVREVVLPPAAAPAATSRPEPRPGSVRATSAPSAPSPPSPAAAQSPRPQQSATSATPAQASAPPAPPAKPDRPPEPTGTSGGGRFGLLEID